VNERYTDAIFSSSQSSIADRFFATARYLVSRQPRYRIGSLGTVYCQPIAAGIAVAGLFVFVMGKSSPLLALKQRKP
jgi:hypothetical protein